MKKIIITAFILLFASACVQFVPNDDSKNIPDQEKPVEFEVTEQKNVIEFSEWHEIEKGLEIKEDVFKNEASDKEEKITLVKIDPNLFEFKISQDTENPKSIFEWQKETNAVLASNGGYFQENFQTAGLLVIDGKTFGPKKSQVYDGMLLISAGFPQLRYLPVSGFDYEKEKIDFGVQSFPVLIKPEGLANLSEDDGKLSRRTVIAQGSDNNIYLIYTHNFNISLFQLMNYLLNSEIKFKIAVNLDGGSSTGLEIKDNDFSYEIQSINQVPNAILVYKK